MRVHLVGVSGAGMGALAALFREAGNEVSGSADDASAMAADPRAKLSGSPWDGRYSNRCRRGAVR